MRKRGAPPGQLLPCTHRPDGAPWTDFGRRDLPWGEQWCGLLQVREESDRTWFRAMVLAHGGSEDLLALDREALPGLWAWLVEQVDVDAPFVPQGGVP